MDTKGAMDPLSNVASLMKQVFHAVSSVYSVIYCSARGVRFVVIKKV